MINITTRKDNSINKLNQTCFKLTPFILKRITHLVTWITLISHGEPKKIIGYCSQTFTHGFLYNALHHSITRSVSFTNAKQFFISPLSYCWWKWRLHIKSTQTFLWRTRPQSLLPRLTWLPDERLKFYFWYNNHVIIIIFTYKKLPPDYIFTGYTLSKLLTQFSMPGCFLNIPLSGSSAHL